MAWDEQRDLRARHAAERGGAPAGAPAVARPAAREHAAALGERLRRNGEPIAVCLAALALLLSGIALARSGHDTSAGGRDHERTAMPRDSGDAGWRGSGPGSMGHARR